MRGRATGVVLPALVVLVLLAVVAIAATGSTPDGDGSTRPPSETLLDTIFSLGLVGVALGGILLFYGLSQRKAIAREVASGRYRRTSLVSFLAFFGLFMLFSYWRLSHWDPQPPEEKQELAFPGETPRPTTPETGTDVPPPYEPSVSWIPIAVVVGLVLAGVVAYVVSERRARGARRSREVLAEQLAVVLDDTLDDLRAEADPRRAIIAAYARLEHVLAANGVPRRAAETPDEYLPRVLHDLELDSGAVECLTALFTRAKFSQHDVDTAMKEEAIGALEQVRDELRFARETPEPARATAPAVGASS
jgi:Domain of unknown function (DUF4129)